MVRLYNNFIVVGTELKEWGEKKTGHKNFKFIPFGLTQNEVQSSSNSIVQYPIQIVIPGMVSVRRKYDKVVRLLNEESIKDYFQFILLGRPFDEYGEQVISQVRDHENVITFDSFIPHEEYDRYLRNCSFILSDFDEEFITMFGQKEIYGTTKETGVIYLMLSHGKPGILPGHYKGMAEVQSQILRFDDYDSLVAIFNKLHEKGSLAMEEIMKDAMKNREVIVSKIDKL